MFKLLAKLSSKHPIAVLALWIVVFAALIPFASRVQDVLKGGGFDAEQKEYYKARQRLAELFGGFQSELVLVFDVPENAPPDYFARVDAAVAPLRNDRDVARVLTYAATRSDPRFLSDSRRHTLALVSFRIDDFKLQQRLKELRTLIKGDGLIWHMTGAAPFNESLTDYSREDAVRGELFAVPLVLLVLLWLFRSVPAAFLPIITAGFSIVTTLGLTWFAGHTTDLSLFVLNVASLLGIGLAIDYSLLIVSRYREEFALARNEGLENGAASDQAIRITLDTAGRAVFFSALTVLVGLSSMLLFGFMFMSSLGIGGMLVVLMSLLASLTLLPACLKLLGGTLERWRLPGRAVDHDVESKPGLWVRLTTFVLRWPLATLLAILLLLAFVGLPALHMRLGTSNAEILPASSAPRQTFDIVTREFDLTPRPGDLQLLVEPKAGTLDDPDNIAAMHSFAARLLADPAVTNLLSPVTLAGALPLEQIQGLFAMRKAMPAMLDPRMALGLESVLRTNAALFRVRTTFNVGERKAENFVRDIRSNQPHGLTVRVTGEIPRLMDFSEGLYSRFPLAAGWIILVTLLLMMPMFRSVWLPVKSVLATLLSLIATFGVLVFIFQDGHFQKLLGFTSPGYTEAVLPAVLFSVLFGLSMDYEVFLLARIREAWQETGDNDRAVVLGVMRTTGLITGAAMCMILVACGFGLAHILPVKVIGVGIALAVAVDATIVRGVLVPAVLKLMGKWNWWIPRWLDRILPDWKGH